MFVLFLLLLVPLAAPSPCAPAVDLIKLGDIQGAYGAYADGLFAYIDKMEDPANTPYAKTLLDKTRQFENKFNKFTIEASNFLIERDLGLLYLLSNPEYAGEKLDQADNHCRWMGGSLLAPDEPDLYKIRVLLYFNPTENVRLPVMGNATHAWFFPSGKSADWIVNFYYNIAFNELPTDNKLGIGISTRTPQVHIGNAVKIHTAILCQLPSDAAIKSQKAWADIIYKRVLAFNETRTTMESAYSALADTQLQVDICPDLLVSVPSAMQNPTAHLTLAAMRRTKISSAADVKTVTDHIAATSMEMQKFLDALENLRHLQDTTLGMTPANNGDWTRIDFDLEEAEEQLIICLSALCSLFLITALHMVVRRTQEWRRTRIRRQLLARYPNIADMPMGERGRLL